MPTTNTPIPDLIELSGVTENTTFSANGTGGGSILGVVDNATYTDDDSSNTATEIRELNEADGGNAGTLTIDGVDYDIYLANPDGPSGNVTYTTSDGGSGTIIEDGDDSEIVFITAIPTGGGATRYFALFDDNVGDISGINSITSGTLDFTPAGDDVMINADENNNISVVCFLHGTLIETPDGPRRVETLASNDLVLTRDHGAQPILWTNSTTISADQLAAQPNLAPVRIAPGALGPGVPDTPLFVSRQHRVLLRSKIAARMFGSSEVLVPAGKLLSLPGVTLANTAAPFTYHHFMCPNHEVVQANGAPCESLMRGDQAVKALKPSLRTAWRLLMRSGRGPVRPIRARAASIETFVQRHKKNAKPIYQM